MLQQKPQGLDVKLRGSNIFTDDITYSYKDINSLPHGLCMESVKIVSVTNGLAFQPHHSFLSNIYLFEIKDNGNIYKSAEHFFSGDLARHHIRTDLIQPTLDAKRLCGILNCPTIGRKKRSCKCEK